MIKHGPVDVVVLAFGEPRFDGSIFTELERQAPPPQQVRAPPPASQDDVIAQLERLGALHAQGILTDEEFTAQKAKILGI